jgi:hypothetical protein
MAAGSRFDRDGSGAEDFATIFFGTAFGVSFDFSTFTTFSSETFASTFPNLRGAFTEYWHLRLPDLQKWQRTPGRVKKQIISEATQALQRFAFRYKQTWAKAIKKQGTNSLHR